jgi:hypothetical protein
VNNIRESTSRRIFHFAPKRTTKSGETTAATPSKAVENGGIMSFPKEHPFAFQLIIATLKTSAADIMCQTVAERKKFSEIDWKRNDIFVLFGFAYLGGFQYWLMVNKYRQWFPTMDSFAKLTLAQKIKDTVKEFVGGHSWNPAVWLTDGCSKYQKNLKEDLTAMIQLWGPSDCIQFALPMHIRMPFRHLVSFFWTAYVSFTRGSIEPVAIQQDSRMATRIS